MNWKDYETTKRTGRVIGLAGVARSGKDSIGKSLMKNSGFTRVSFAGPVYEGLYALNPIVTFTTVHRDGYLVDVEPVKLQTIVNQIGWEEAKVKFPEIRNLLQKYGTEAGRDIHGEDCWIKILKQKVEDNPLLDYVITDVRFPNEVAAIRRLEGKLVQVTRPDTTSVNDHVSDKPLDSTLFDTLVVNDGTLEDLDDKISTL